MNKKGPVLITGSSGFIGDALAKRLSKEYEVIGLDLMPPKKKVDQVAYYSVDMTSTHELKKVLKEIKSNHGDQLLSVIHLVAYYSFSGKEDEKYESITVNGTRELMRHLRDNFSLEQFIFSSSMLVYAPVTPGEKIKDNSPLDPSWPYPKSKVRAEKTLKEVHGSVPVVNLRIAGVYDDNCHSPTLSNQIIRIHERWVTSVPFPGDPDRGQAFLHLDDLIEAISKLIEKRGSLDNFETFVMGEEEVMTYRQLQSNIGQLLYNRPWPTVRVPLKVARWGAKIMEQMPFMREPFIKPWMIEHSDEHFALDMSRLKNAIDWHPKHSLQQKLPVMVEKLKEAPSQWYAINKIKPPFYRTPEMIGPDQERNQFLLATFNCFLGLWLMANPFTFGGVERPEFWSEFITGIMVSVFAALSLIPSMRWFRWINAFLGLWLMFSPLVFESNEPAAYSNDTLIGGIIMLASVYTPSPIESAGNAGIPPGWSYNPSTAGQRIPIMFLAFMGFLLSRYLAAFQLGHIESIWEPFFGTGTERVLTSSVSKAFPISDAGLGALTYLLDVVAASIGGRERWRTLPWAVILFGLMIIPAGVTSIVLIMLQPISVGAWCTICLLTAFIMLLMVPPAIDEVLASIQFLRRSKKGGAPFWKTFWLGQAAPEIGAIAPQLVPKGSNLPVLFSTLLAIWLMFVPWVFNIQGLQANNIYIVAALMTTFSVTAWSEAGRPARLINVPLGLWLAGAVWSLGPMAESARWHAMIVGLLVCALGLPLGRTSQQHGSFDRIIHWVPKWK